MPEQHARATAGSCLVLFRLRTLIPGRAERFGPPCIGIPPYSDRLIGDPYWYTVGTLI